MTKSTRNEKITLRSFVRHALRFTADVTLNLSVQNISRVSHIVRQLCSYSFMVLVLLVYFETRATLAVVSSFGLALFVFAVHAVHTFEPLPINHPKITVH